MNKKISFATFMKDFSNRHDSHYYLLLSDGKVEQIRRDDLQCHADTLFFHDTSLLIDEFVVAKQTFPPNIADASHLAMTICSNEDKKTTTARSNVARLLQSIEGTNHAAIDQYLSAFWGHMELRSSQQKLNEIVQAFLNCFKLNIIKLIEDLAHQPAVNRFFSIEQPAFAVVANISVEGVLYDSRMINGIRRNVEKNLYTRIKTLSDTTNIPLCLPNEYDKTKILKQYGDEAVHVEQVDRQIELLAATEPVLGTLADVISLRREQQIFKKIPASGSRLHPIVEIFGTTTGRIIFKDPELQNISKVNRRIISAPPGHQFIYVDYDQFEAGILGSLSGCADLIDLYNSRDIYEFIADSVFSDISSRNFAKVLFLSYSYGMSVTSLKKLANKHQLGAGVRLEKFFKRFKRIMEWKEELYSEVLSTSRISTAQACTKYFKISDGDLSPKQRRTIVSHKVQGTGSLIFKEALVMIHSEIRPHAKIVLPMHDAFLVLCRSDKVELVTVTVVEFMKKSLKRWCPALTPKVSVSNYFSRNLQVVAD
ncbi:MAG: DNA polymerase [Candidatus Obscuribacterales bacterium]|nr:DNA polymerase [Candidatus Obscuribacterales bacterium]